ncbi:MAG: phosphotransferase [Canibacter sp.]
MPQQMQKLFEESGLTGSHDPVSPEILRTALHEHYGLDGTLQAIDTEKDSTFRLRRDGTDYLVKVSPPDEPLAIVHCQTDVIEWVERTDPSIPVQSVARTGDGSNYRELHDDSGRFLGVLRVLKFIPGMMLSDASPTSEQLHKVGEMLARVNIALQGFEHEGLERPLVWDIGHFMTLKPLLEYEANAARRKMAEQVFDLYRAHLEPVRHELRTQVLHGDFSAFNVVVDPEGEQFVSGVIDFGDIQFGPRIFDLAVLFANHLLTPPAHPWQTSRDMLVGYLRVIPLSTTEIELLTIASLARVVVRALVTNWRIAEVPERAEYLRMHARKDWERIENAINFGIDAAAEYLLTAQDITQPNRTQH